MAICARSDKKLVIPGNIRRMLLHYLELKFSFATLTRWQALMLLMITWAIRAREPASSCCFLCAVLLVIRNYWFCANYFLRFVSTWLGYDQPERRGVAGEMSAKEQWRTLCMCVCVRAYVCVHVCVCVCMYKEGQDARDTLSQGACLLPPRGMTVHAVACLLSPKAFDLEEEEGLTLAVP